MSRHILVVGAGIAGLATAWALRRRGAAVEVVERGPVGRESSWAGAGILSLLLPQDYGPGLVNLTRYSADRYPEWIAGLGRTSVIDPEYRQTGMLVRSSVSGSGLEAGAISDLPPQLEPKNLSWTHPSVGLSRCLARRDDAAGPSPARRSNAARRRAKRAIGCVAG